MRQNGLNWRINYSRLPVLTSIIWGKILRPRQNFYTTNSPYSLFRFSANSLLQQAFHRVYRHQSVQVCRVSIVISPLVSRSETKFSFFLCFIIIITINIFYLFFSKRVSKCISQSKLEWWVQTTWYSQGNLLMSFSLVIWTWTARCLKEIVL